ncbi:hypothetical protein Ahy_B01g056082 [Arachis hypogaea]|uniref:SWIM-type domain-containing protein n=1 Tax=Arachis hypogaea TaxID=3818 RepID=A0A445AXW4_ARAHY|nr:hypothetical protein Ahy_B01g056082 [Arachis hypogaea]
MSNDPTSSPPLPFRSAAKDGDATGWTAGSYTGTEEEATAGRELEPAAVAKVVVFRFEPPELDTTSTSFANNSGVINQAIGEEEIDPEEGMCFGTLEDARAYYYRYAARTGFVVKIRTTGWETRNDQRVVVNQALHCNRDGYRTFLVKAPKRRKTVASTNCKARCYLALDKMTGQWRISRVELSHSHPLNPKLSVMFSTNRQLSMHVKDLIQQNDQACIRSSKTYQALANTVGGPANLTFTEKDIPNKLVGYRHFDQLITCMKRIVFESKSKDSFERDWHDFIEEYDLHNSRWLNGSIIFRSPIEKQFQREYTNSMFQDVQDQFIKKADCDISSVNHHGTSIVCEVDQQKMVFDMSVYSRYQVMYCSQSSDVQCDCFMFQSNGILCCHSLAVLLHFHVTTVSSQYILSRWSKNVSRRHTYIRSSIDMDRSDESMTIFRELCSDFYNVAQDFVVTPEVAAILRDAMDSAR